MSAKKTIKFLSLKYQQDVIKSEAARVFADTFEKSHYILGPQLLSFEQKFATYCESKFCVGVGSGLEALTISLKALDLTSDDEVIVPANTYHATWLAVANVGAKIVAVEPDALTYNLDVKKVGDSITKKTKAIVPVHLYGQACNMTQLVRISEENKIAIVEDNAQAHGGAWKNRRTGSWGVINSTSFYPTKNLGALGDGGAITTNDSVLANFAQRYRNYGSAVKNQVDELGVNSRLDELQAGLLTLKLNQLDKWNGARRILADKYNERLKNVPGVTIPFSDPDAFHVYHLYVIRVERRNELQSYLSKNGIETLVHYPVPPHLQKAYGKFELGKFPISEALADTLLSLPLWPGITDDELDFVTDAIKRFCL